MAVTLNDAKRIAKQLGTNVDPKRLLEGMKVELEEHGKTDPRLNVTDDDLVSTAKIALAHFKENPGAPDYGDYYVHLQKMERDNDKYWSHHLKPDIFGLKLKDLTDIHGWM